MKIQLWSIGKAHESIVKEGIEVFTRRISKYYRVEWRIFEPARQTVNSLENDIRKIEANTILQALQKDDYLVLLDETGKQITSPQLASFIEARGDSSVRQLVFLIGGAFGVNEDIKRRADFTWSLSHLVFPHQIVRLLLAEQIYRASTIIRNENYHHQ